MQTVTLAFENKKTEQKILWFLNHFKDDGVEIVSQEDVSDMKAIEAVRGEESITLEEYLKNES